MAERPFQPVPNTPLVADPTRDAIWKRWLQGLQQFLGSAVRGPGSSTDNAVARWDGTSGQFLNNSGVIIDDSNNVSGVVNLTTTGNTILGDASADTLTINAGTWTYGANWTATRAAGTVAAGSVDGLTTEFTFTGDAGGTTSLRSNIIDSTSEGGNAISVHRALQVVARHSGSATLGVLNGLLYNINVTGSGDATNAQACIGALSISGGSTVTTADMFTANVPSITSGSATTINGYRVLNIGHANIGTANGINIQDITTSATINGVLSQISAGSGKKNLNITGTAENYLAGDLTCDANVTLGNASADTLTINAGTWTYGANWTATRATGAFSGSIDVLTNIIQATPNAAASAQGAVNRLSVLGANNPATMIGFRGLLTQDGTGTITTAVGASYGVSVLAAGNVTEARALQSFMRLTSTGAITTGVGLSIETPERPTGTGTITTNYGVRVKDMGASWITTAIGVSVEDQTSATTMIGVQSAVSAGSGKKNLNITGTADNSLAGPLYLAQDNKTQQTAAAIYAGTGAPNNANGSDGDFYLRGNGTVAGSNIVYHKEAGAWVALTGGGGGGASGTTVEVDLGTPKFTGKFTITDAAISATSKVQCWQAPGPYTGKGTLADEAMMQPVQIIAVAPAAGSAVVYWQTPPYVAMSQQLSNGQFGAAGATFDRLMNQRTPAVFTPKRLGKVRGNVKFTYTILS